MTRKAAVIVLLAVRNLRRYLRRTVLTSLALVLGGALLMISLPLNDGTHEAWIFSGVRMGSGWACSVTITACGFIAGTAGSSN